MPMQRKPGWKREKDEAYTPDVPTCFPTSGYSTIYGYNIIKNQQNVG